MLAYVNTQIVDMTVVQLLKCVMGAGVRPW